MNNTTKQMKNRGSVRKFDSKPIPQEILDDILQATIHSPTYANGQQYSIIVVTDQEKKEKLVECTAIGSGKGMTYIQKAPVFLLFVMDFNKIDRAIQTEHKICKIQDSIESLLIGSVDVGIALEAATVAIESHGLGCVPVGAIRASVEKIIDIFELPPYTYPLVGLSLGYIKPDTSVNITPRLPLEGFIHHNVYNKEGFDKILETYNNQMALIFKSRDLDLTWTKLMVQYYTSPYFRKQTEIFKKQGFNFNY